MNVNNKYKEQETTNEFSESLIVHFRRAENLRAEMIEAFSIYLDIRQLCDLELLLNRAYYPLTGYLNKSDYEKVLETKTLIDKTVWPIPICLDVTEKIAGSLQTNQRVALRDGEGFLLAVLTVQEIWKPDKEKEAFAVYGTTDPKSHPGVQNLYEQADDWYLGGSVEGVCLPIHYDFKELRLTPSESHRKFTQFGWRRVLGFHTRKYLHRAQYSMILTAAKEIGASIFMHPAVGLRYPGNMDHYSHVHCYREIAKYFPKNMIMLGLIPICDRFAGPNEALLHAIIRKNFGCSHFMVSQDHGDPFSEAEGKLYYPRGAAQDLVRQHSKEIGIEMVPEREMVYIEEEAQYVFLDQVGKKVIKRLTTEELNRRLELGLEIPTWFSYPEVINELRRTFPPRSRQGFTIFLTGLSGSGKSTIAKVLMVKFMEMRGRPVTLLDGDIVRKNLSSELNYSEEHRNLNVTRIGFVASEITKNGGIALCAPIAPYEESRQANRSLISRYGGYIEVYVSTPLEVCEQRDRKGLYAKARAGVIKRVTGISDPYVPPNNPELTIDTSNMTPAEAVQEIMLYLTEHGYIT